MRKTLFIKNAAILTATSLILRGLGMILRAYIASSVGDEGMGLYQLVFSVYTFAAAFTGAGIPTAVTRLAADEIAYGDKDGLSEAVTKGLSGALFFAALSFTAVFFGAEFISEKLLGTDAALCLKILCFSLPFMAASSVIKSYFAARRKAFPSSISQLLEQAARMILCFSLIKKFAVRGTVFAVAAVIISDTAAEIISFLFLTVVFSCDLKKVKPKGQRVHKNTGKELTRIAVPLTAGRYLTTSLRSIENVLLPRMLAVTLGMSEAMKGFGAVKGMALPLLLFPSSVLFAVSGLLIPEMSEAKTGGKPYVIKYAVRKTLSVTLLLGVGSAFVFMLFGEKAASLIYKSALAEKTVKYLAPLTPVMYIDGVCDGLLKGLDRQNITFRNALIDSAVRIGLIFILPRYYGLPGFIAVMYISNILTCTLNLLELKKVTFGNKYNKRQCCRALP